MAVDLTTGERSFLSSTAVPAAAMPYVNPTEIALDPLNGRALVVSNVSLLSDGIIAMDLNSGQRNELADPDPGALPIDEILGIAVDISG